MTSVLELTLKHPYHLVSEAEGSVEAIGVILSASDMREEIVPGGIEGAISWRRSWGEIKMLSEKLGQSVHIWATPSTSTRSKTRLRKESRSGRILRPLGGGWRYVRLDGRFRNSRRSVGKVLGTRIRKQPRPWRKRTRVRMIGTRTRGNGRRGSRRLWSTGHWGLRRSWRTEPVRWSLRMRRD